MDNKIKLITFMCLSFALVLGVFLGILIGLYLFGLSIANNTSNFINDVPLEKMLSIGGISTLLFFISKKYANNTNNKN